MQVGDPGTDIRTVLLTTDITETVVDEAIMLGCNLIISHHPLLFHGLKQVCGQTPQARCVEKAIRHGIAIYSSHTAMDSWLHGVSGRIAEKIGVKKYRIMAENGEGYGLGVIGELAEAMPFETFVEHVKRFNKNRRLPEIEEEIIDILWLFFRDKEWKDDEIIFEHIPEMLIDKNKKMPLKKVCLDILQAEIGRSFEIRPYGILLRDNPFFFDPFTLRELIEWVYLHETQKVKRG